MAGSGEGVGCWGLGRKPFFCVLYLLSMANVDKNQSSGAGGGGVGKEGTGRRPWASFFALISFFFSFFLL